MLVSTSPTRIVHTNSTPKNRRSPHERDQAKTTLQTAPDSGGWGGSYGYYVKLDHGNGLQTLYAHCQAICVTAGRQVQAGQVIGYVGHTGRATGDHLHFEVYENGQRTDAMQQFSYMGAAAPTPFYLCIHTKLSCLALLGRYRYTGVRAVLADAARLCLANPATMLLWLGLVLWLPVSYFFVPALFFYLRLPWLFWAAESASPRSVSQFVPFSKE